MLNPLYYKSCVCCHRLEQRSEALTERDVRELIFRWKDARPPKEQRREALTEREAREVILRDIDAQCNKRTPLVELIPVVERFHTTVCWSSAVTLEVFSNSFFR